MKRAAADLPLGARTEQMIMCQLDMVHFEDVRGMFRFSEAPAAGDFMNYVTMIDVTRELCGLFDAQNGNPYGVVEYTNLNILGRHDQWGELTAQGIGTGSTIRSQMPWAGSVVDGGGASGSPSTVNVLSQRFVLPSGGTNLIKSLVLAEGGNHVFDITSRAVINGGAGGVKTFHSYGITQPGTVGRWHDSAGEVASRVTVSVSSASGNQMQEFIVSNTTGSTLTVDLILEKNSTGVQCYIA